VEGTVAPAKLPIEQAHKSRREYTGPKRPAKAMAQQRTGFYPAT
jgi:hypothetical protein